MTLRAESRRCLELEERAQMFPCGPSEDVRVLMILYESPAPTFDASCIIIGSSDLFELMRDRKRVFLVCPA